MRRYYSDTEREVREDTKPLKPRYDRYKNRYDAYEGRSFVYPDYYSRNDIQHPKEVLYLAQPDTKVARTYAEERKTYQDERKPLINGNKLREDERHCSNDYRKYEALSPNKHIEEENRFKPIGRKSSPTQIVMTSHMENSGNTKDTCVVSSTSIPSPVIEKNSYQNTENQVYEDTNKYRCSHSTNNEYKRKAYEVLVFMFPDLHEVYLQDVLYDFQNNIHSAVEYLLQYKYTPREAKYSPREKKYLAKEYFQPRYISTLTSKESHNQTVEINQSKNADTDGSQSDRLDHCKSPNATKINHTPESKSEFSRDLNSDLYKPRDNTTDTHQSYERSTESNQSPYNKINMHENKFYVSTTKDVKTEIVESSNNDRIPYIIA